MSNLLDKVVLVTGGTGSFGKKFVKKALTLGAKKIIVFIMQYVNLFFHSLTIKTPCVNIKK